MNPSLKTIIKVSVCASAIYGYTKMAYTWGFIKGGLFVLKEGVSLASYFTKTKNEKKNVDDSNDKRGEK